VDYGPTIDAARLRSFLARFQSGSTRTYPTQEYAEVIDATGYQVASCDESGTLCGGAAFANTELYIGTDGFMVDETVAQVSVSAGGYLTVTATTGELQAACMVDDNGFTLGGEVTLIGVETTVGKVNGSYVGISAGLSEGFYVAGAVGKGGQYGFS